jgi:hypothetical protein
VSEFEEAGFTNRSAESGGLAIGNKSGGAYWANFWGQYIFS